ncbi:MAG: hypothetical protein QM762_14465 [Chryseolinea sp.]
MSIPLLTNLVRPPYNGFDQYIVEHENEVAHLSVRGKTATFNKYIAFDWKTRYQYNLSERVGLVFNFLLRYQFVAGDNNVKHLQNQLTTGIAVKW